MAKTASKKLFNIIRSLTGSERRYFKISVNPTGDKGNKYSQLFDSILAQEEFDDEALQYQIYGHKQSETRKFSELKNYLFNQILKSLQGFDEKTSIEYKIKNHMMNVKVLFKRSLFTDCTEELEKAKKLAEKYELFSSGLEILKREKEIAYAKADIAFLDKNLISIIKKEKELLTNQALLIDLRNLFFEIYISLRKDVSPTPERKQKLENLANKPAIIKSKNHDSYRISVGRLRIISILKLVNRDFVGFHNLSSQLLKLMESKNHFLREDVSEYISALNNHIISCGQLEIYDEIDKNLLKLKEVNAITGDDVLKIHGQYYMNKFRLCIEKGEFEEGVKEIESHQKEVRKYGSANFSKSNFFFQYFNIFFGAGNYEKALQFLNEWLNQPRNVERQDLQALARVLNLLVHYEIGNYILLESLIRSASRYLKKENRIFEFEKRIMDFFNSTINQPKTKKELKEAGLHLKEQLDHLLQFPSENRMMRMFDFQSWIESKISGESFGTVAKRKFTQKSISSS